MSGASATATALTPVDNFGSEVMVATRIMPRNARPMPVLSAMASTARVSRQPAYMTTSALARNRAIQSAIAGMIGRCARPAMRAPAAHFLSAARVRFG